jgi:hypothetical protein
MGLSFSRYISQWGNLLFWSQNAEKHRMALMHDGDYSAITTIWTIDMDAVYLQRSAAMWSELQNIINTITSLPTASPTFTTGASHQ